MEVKLVVAKGNSAGRVVPVTGPKFFIGRAPDCHLRPGSNLISRHHCAILVKEGLVSVRDFGSTNGTAVNGERIRGERELSDGDCLAIGPLEFEVRLAADTGPQERPRPQRPSNAAARISGSLADDDLDVSKWLGDTAAVSPAPGPQTRTPDAPATESAGAEQAVEQSSEESQEEHDMDVSEERKEQMRRGGNIVGVSRAAQAKRVSETSHAAAADALKKFFS